MNASKLVCAILLLTSSLALASEKPMPAIDPIPPQLSPVLQLQISGGMPVPGGLASTILTVERSGDVRVQEKHFNNPSQDVDFVLTQATPLEMLIIGENLVAIKGGPLASLHPDQPACEDAPGSTYTVYNSKKIEFYAIESCIGHALKDPSQREAASILKSVLDGFQSQLNHHQAEN